MKALEIDETLAEAHASLGTVKMLYDWDRAGAEIELKRAIDLNPNYSEAHAEYGGLLESVERFDQAVAERKRAQETDPLSPIATADVGYPLYYARRYDQAIEHYRRGLELDPNFSWSHLWIGQAEVQQGKYKEAIVDIKRAVALSAGNTRAIATLGHAQAVAGNRKEAQVVLNQLVERSRQSYVSPYYFALLYTGLGEKDLALEWLEKAYEERQPYLYLLKVEPVFDGLHSDPRFQGLLRRLGLAP
jgi:tetratricopeptide (TPR) repeat protein